MLAKTASLRISPTSRIRILCYVVFWPAKITDENACRPSSFFRKGVQSYDLFKMPAIQLTI